MTTSAKVYRLDVPADVGTKGDPTNISDLKAPRSAAMTGTASTAGTLRVLLGDVTSQDVLADQWIWNAAALGEERDNTNAFTYACVYRVAAGSGEVVQVAGELDTAASVPQSLDLTIRHANLTAEATSQAFSMGLVPAGARLLANGVPLPTPFAGGTVSDAIVKVGTAGDLDGVIAAAQVFAAAVDGQCSSVGLGIAPQRYFAEETELFATFVAVGGNVADLTAGEVQLRLSYVVIP